METTFFKYSNATFPGNNTYDYQYIKYISSSFNYSTIFYYYLIAMLSILAVLLSHHFKYLVVTCMNNCSKAFLSRNKQLLGRLVRPASRRLPPGPSPKWPVLGCLPEMWASNLSPPQWIHRLMEHLGTDIACVRLGNTHVVAVSSPEIAKEFLKKHDAAFASRPVTMATRIISEGFLSTALAPGGEQWKKMRRVLVSQVLSQSRLRWLLDMRNQEADDLVRFLYNQCSKSPQGEANLSILSSCLFIEIKVSCY